MRFFAICTAVLATALASQMVWSQASTEAPTESSETLAADQARLEELMSLMGAEMAALNETENRQEREALMSTHRDHMREALALMSSMGGDAMSLMMEHMAARAPAAASVSDRRHIHRRPLGQGQRSQMSDASRLMDLETRVDMMQLMMESMIERSVTE